MLGYLAIPDVRVSSVEHRSITEHPGDGMILAVPGKDITFPVWDGSYYVNE